MQQSIILSAIRSFFVSLFAMVGIGVGLIPLILILSLVIARSDESLEVKNYYSPTIVTNAQNTRKALSKSAPVILKLNVSGIIGTDKLNMHTIKQELTESREGDLKDNRVKAVLVHIDSPGGTVSDADGIYRAIKEYKERYKVPVFAYIDGMCASGGMYVAAACDKIYSSDTSIIGSIGVISSPYFNLVGLTEKLGVETKTLYAGKGKDNLNPFRPWKAGEDENIKTIIDYFYNHFVGVITSNRTEISKSRLINDYGANVFSAEKAMEYGFIDGSGNTLNDTLTTLAKNIGIDDDYYQVIKMERKISLGDLFKGDSPMMSGIVKHKLEISPEFDSRLMNQFLYLYLPGM
jgi:protease-4